MSREATDKALAAILPVAAEAVAEQADAKAAGRFPDRRFNLWEISKPVGEALARLQEFSVDRGFVDFGGGGMSFHPSMFAPRFVQIAVERGVEAAFSWVEKVLHTRVAEARCVCLVRGLKVAQAIPFANGKITLVPFDALPESDHKESERGKGYMFPGSAFPRDLPATAALTAPVTVNELFIRDFSASPLRSLILELERVANALSMVTGNATLPEKGWAEYVDPDINAIAVGRSHYGGMEEIRPFFLQDHQIDEALASKFIDGYLALPQDVRDLIDVAIKRLNHAMRRQNPMDKALDAAIGLEVLLGDKQDQGEITERLSRRGAILVGGDLAKRHETRQAIRHLYRFRSAVVHTGNVGGISKKANPQEVTAKGIEIGLAAVHEIIALRSMPPWDEWELMGRA